jgi:hypothetical protein
MSEKDHQVPLNNPIGAGLEFGFRRRGFRLDSPRWITLMAFALFVGTLIAVLLR